VTRTLNFSRSEQIVIHRLTEYLQETWEDYWVIGCQFGWYFVSPETGHEVVEMLDMRNPPRWIQFTDLHGSDIRVLSDAIVRVEESTRDQRELERAFLKSLREEDEADKPPEDQWT
jgi:hypothetical protein